jgi:peptidoglycan/xylan/chitin deacetylase (PgdA/CDA1 family)
MSRQTTLGKVVLSALHYSGADAMIAPLTRGIGAIFMLHHVCPAKPDKFEPNRFLKVAPNFLEQAIRQVRASGFEIVSLDEAHFRLVEGEHRKPFVCFTFDDGYRDNRDFALPVMRAFDAPLTIYVTSDFAEGTGRLWWIALEMAIASTTAIEVTVDGTACRFDAATPAAKQTTFDRLHDWLRTLNEHDLRREVSALCARHGVDEAAICRDLCMSWDELKPFSADPLVAIGAHTLTHCNLAAQSDETLNEELIESRARIEAMLDRPVAHLAYPYGDKAAAGAREFALAGAAGYRTAVTTRPGMVFAENAGHLTALPRVSLNGNYQDARILPVLTSGAATAMWNGFRRVDAA